MKNPRASQGKPHMGKLIHLRILKYCYLFVQIGWESSGCLLVSVDSVSGSAPVRPEEYFLRNSRCEMSVFHPVSDTLPVERTSVLGGHAL